MLFHRMTDQSRVSETETTNERTNEHHKSNKSNWKLTIANSIMESFFV